MHIWFPRASKVFCGVLCAMITACAGHNPEQNETAMHKQLNDRLRAKLSAFTEKQRSNSDKGKNENYISVKLYKLPGPGYGAILKIDPSNKENHSMTDVIAAVTSFITSSGFIKVDCSSNQIACFKKEKSSLSLEPTDAVDTIRIQLMMEKNEERVSYRVPDTMLQFFIEVLLSYLQQSGTPHKVLRQLN